MPDEKTSEGVNPNIWIRPPEEKSIKSGIAGTAPSPQPETPPKYKTFDVLTLRISSEDFEFLQKLEREIMKNRSKENKKERITKNSIMRAMLACLKNVKFDRKDIPDENELRIRMMRGLKDLPPWLF
ncbi:MAG: hypothetical protein OXK19_01110 [Candidatus Dadabacteria bacterium]|nr:hypothetical protein [Candidatus Dadabacteria bacterium]MXZ48012.1 hypothetical protein [Candidatus Dadabacteria bacterium]